MLSACLITVALALASVLSAYYFWFYTRLRRCGIPGPTPWPLLGNFVEQNSLGMFNADAIWLKKYGKCVGHYIGHTMTILVSDPAILKQVLVKEFNNFTERTHQTNTPFPGLIQKSLFFMRGQHWRKTRNIMTPTFSAGKIKQVYFILNDCARKLTRNVVRLTEEPEAKVIKGPMGAFSIDAIASIAFGLDIDSQNEPDEPFVKNIVKIFSSEAVGFLRRIPIMLAALFPCTVPLMVECGYSIWPRDAVKFYNNIGLAIIKDRKLHPTAKVDFLQLLLNAESISDKGSAASGQRTVNGLQNGTSTNQGVHRLTTSEINSQLFLFFLAGNETTSTLLTYATYRLAIHEDMDKLMYEEIMEKIGETNPTYDDVSQLKYMDMFVNETLRFYPSVARLLRTAASDIEVEGLTIPKGAQLVVPVHAIHHTAEFYPDPEEFRPERFSPENKSNVNPLTYLPFGYGPRNCIGMRLALVEAKIALVHMLRRVRFVRSPETEFPLKMTSQGLYRPEKAIKLRVELRTA